MALNLQILKRQTESELYYVGDVVHYWHETRNEFVTGVIENIDFDGVVYGDGIARAYVVGLHGEFADYVTSELLIPAGTFQRLVEVEF